MGGDKTHRNVIVTVVLIALHLLFILVKNGLLLLEIHFALKFNAVRVCKCSIGALTLAWRLRQARRARLKS